MAQHPPRVRAHRDTAILRQLDTPWSHRNGYLMAVQHESVSGLEVCRGFDPIRRSLLLIREWRVGPHPAIFRVRIGRTVAMSEGACSSSPRKVRAPQSRSPGNAWA